MTNTRRVRSGKLVVVAICLMAVMVAVTAVQRPTTASSDSIAGRILDSNGAPLIHAELRYTFQGGGRIVGDDAAVDEQGHFRISRRSGYHLQVFLPPSGIVGYYAATSQGGFSFFRSEATELSTVETSEITIQLPPTGILSGSLLSAEGLPIDAPTWLWLSEAGGSRRQINFGIQPDAEGNFILGAPEGEWTLAGSMSHPTRGFQQFAYTAGAPGNLRVGAEAPTRVRFSAGLVHHVELKLALDQITYIPFSREDGATFASHDPPEQREIAERKKELRFAACLAEDEAWLRFCGISQNPCFVSAQYRTLSDSQFIVGLPTEPAYLSIRYEGTTYYYTDELAAGWTMNPGVRTAITAMQAAELDDFRFTIPTPRDYEVDMKLQPGGNLVGWHGGVVSFEELFAQLPVPVGVIKLRPDGTPLWTGLWTESGSALPEGWLAYGDLMFVYTAGSVPLSVTIGSDDPPPYLSLNPGVNFVAWPGPDRTDLDVIRRGLGSPLVALAAFDADGLPYTSAGEVLVDRGQLLRIELDARVRWLPNPDLESDVIFAGATSEPQREQFREWLQRARAYFWNEFGVVAADTDVIYSEDWEADTGWPLGEPVAFAHGHFAIYMGVWSELTLVHEYVHALQSLLQGCCKFGPLWLTEGSAEYLASGYGRANGMLGAGETKRHRQSTVWLTPFLKGAIDQALDDNPYVAGEMAVEWLANNSDGDAAIIDYFRLLASAESWQEAFARAFGLSVDEFYRRFGSEMTAQ
ncbi:MAG: hypothetical protein OXH38_07305 [Chloroflexi bacterium]|nr:hypothetical protein [Chloroflexota bacterium]